MKSLVVFYSLTGNTRSVASTLAALLDAESEQILTVSSYKGGWGYLKAAYHSMVGHPVGIQPPGVSPNNYDIVVIAGPIWVGHVAPPLQTYLRKFHGNFKHVAYCVTRGGSSPDKVFSEMEALSGKPPIGKLALTANEVTDGSYEGPANDFVKAIKDALANRLQTVA